MKVYIDGDGQIIPTNDRDKKLMFLTKQVDAFLLDREKNGLFHEVGILEKFMFVDFVMWLNDNNKLK